MITTKRTLTLVSLAGLSLLLGVGVVSPTPSSAQDGAAPRPGVAGQHRPNRREGHPELGRAMRALTNAQNFLQHADRDFGGHREKALDLTQRAMAEVRAAIEFDKH